MTPVKYESDSKNIAVFLQNKKILHGKNNKRGFSNPHPGLAGFRDPFLNLSPWAFIPPEPFDREMFLWRNYRPISYF